MIIQSTRTKEETDSYDPIQNHAFFLFYFLREVVYLMWGFLKKLHNSLLKSPHFLWKIFNKLFLTFFIKNLINYQLFPHQNQ